MGDYIDAYSKFLIGNVNFFHYVMEKLLLRDKINSDLILKVQRRLKVLKLIDNVSLSLEKYFYGENYIEIMEHYNIYDDFDIFVENLLRYRECNLDIILTDKIKDRNLYKICSKSYPTHHNYECSDNIEIKLGSNELFLEDYTELTELYFILNEIAPTSINFVINDLVNGEVYLEDRISNYKHKNYVNTKINIIKVSDYSKLLINKDIDQFILDRLSFLDDNPIWRYYLLNIKISNNELSNIIEKYAVYIRDNYSKYLYLNEDLYKFIGIRALLVLCEQALDKNDEESFIKYFNELNDLESNLLELMYLKAKKLTLQNTNNIDELLFDIQNRFNENTYTVCSDTIKKLYKKMGELHEQKGNYILAAEAYHNNGELIDYINKLGQTVNDLSKGLYRNNKYSSGVILTSRITTNTKLITDNSDKFDVLNIVGHDYARLFTLELCANEIYNNNIEGQVAELGVFRGDFAKVLNVVFPDRKLFLFDTFDSFNEDDIKLEKSISSIDNDVFNELTSSLRNTSIDLVMSKMKNPNNVRIKQGYFPDTSFGVDETFCFVSLDVDLYKPSLEGLKYFYTRLSKSGFIFIHDYNHQLFSGVKKAVTDFEEYIGHRLCKVPLSDQAGTLVITK